MKSEPASTPRPLSLEVLSRQAICCRTMETGVSVSCSRSCSWLQHNLRLVLPGLMVASADHA